MTIVFPATRPRDEAGSRAQRRARRQRRVRGIEHDQTDSRRAPLIPTHRPRGDRELAHGRPQHDEQEEIDQCDERDAECRVEPTVGNELIDRRLDHPAATVYRTAAERHFVANGDGGGVQAHAIDPGAVRAPEVDRAPALTIRFQPGMMARDLRIGKHQIVVVRAADSHRA